MMNLKSEHEVATRLARQMPRVPTCRSFVVSALEAVETLATWVTTSGERLITILYQLKRPAVLEEKTSSLKSLIDGKVTNVTYGTGGHNGRDYYRARRWTRTNRHVPLRIINVRATELCSQPRQ